MRQAPHIKECCYPGFQIHYLELWGMGDLRIKIMVWVKCLVLRLKNV
jgi:hypothetical protein